MLAIKLYTQKLIKNSNLILNIYKEEHFIKKNKTKDSERRPVDFEL